MASARRSRARGDPQKRRCTSFRPSTLERCPAATRSLAKPTRRVGKAFPQVRSGQRRVERKPRAFAQAGRHAMRRALVFFPNIE
jgi:hypothetical protein